MDRTGWMATSSNQKHGPARLLAPGAKRWNLGNITFKDRGGGVCNELTEVWLDLMRDRRIARFHCWTHAVGGYSAAPFEVKAFLYDAHDRLTGLLRWGLFVPPGLDVECRLEAPYRVIEFDASERLEVAAATQAAWRHAQ